MDVFSIEAEPYLVVFMQLLIIHWTVLGWI